MKKLLILIALMLSYTVHCQIPVTDVAAITNDTYNHIEQLVTAQQQLTNTLEQLGISKQMLDGMNKAYERYEKVNEKIKTGRTVYQMVKMTYDMKDMYVDFIERLTLSIDELTFNKTLGHISNATGILNSTIRQLMAMEECLTETLKMDDKQRQDRLEITVSQARSNYLLLADYYHKYMLEQYNLELQKRIAEDYGYFINN